MKFFIILLSLASLMTSCPSPEPTEKVSVDLNVLLINAPDPGSISDAYDSYEAYMLAESPAVIRVKNQSGDAEHFFLYPKSIPEGIGSGHFYIMSLPNTLDQYSEVTIEDSEGMREIALELSELDVLDVNPIEVSYRSSGGTRGDLYRESRGDVAISECLASWMKMAEEDSEANENVMGQAESDSELAHQWHFFWESKAYGNALPPKYYASCTFKQVWREAKK